ncbi:MAG: aldehyde dehydrogenase family protein, partial [Halopseudomonas sp.]
MMTIYDKLYINGQWVAASNGRTMDVINPATESVAGQVAVANADDVNDAVLAARRAFADWSLTSSAERSGYISKIAELLAARREQMAQLITSEMGAPIGFCQEVQVDDPIDALLKHAERTQLLDKELKIGNASAIREPVGVCAFINPWNYPLHQLIGKVAPALAAGCTMVVKPSEATPLHA